MQDGADGPFRDASRGRTFAAASPGQVVERTLHEDPPAATHRKPRAMAKTSGLGPAAVHRIWRGHGLKPHRVEAFKLSNDPRFVGKVRDIGKLCVNPPERALVRSVDKKRQIQALDRTRQHRHRQAPAQETSAGISPAGAGAGAGLVEQMATACGGDPLPSDVAPLWSARAGVARPPSPRYPPLAGKRP